MSGVGNYMLFWVNANYQVIEVSRNFDALLTVATLPAPAALYKVVRYTVSDSTVAAAGNFGAVVAGGGVNVVPVFYDGGNWRIG